jgi:hypothetical protein
MKGIPKRTKIEKIDEGIEFLPLNQWVRERERERERGWTRNIEGFCANYNWGSIPNKKGIVIPLLFGRTSYSSFCKIVIPGNNKLTKQRNNYSISEAYSTYQTYPKSLDESIYMSYLNSISKLSQGLNNK